MIIILINNKSRNNRSNKNKNQDQNINNNSNNHNIYSNSTSTIAFTSSCYVYIRDFCIRWISVLLISYSFLFTSVKTTGISFAHTLSNSTTYVSFLYVLPYTSSVFSYFYLPSGVQHAPISQRNVSNTTIRSVIFEISLSLYCHFWSKVEQTLVVSRIFDSISGCSCCLLKPTLSCHWGISDEARAANAYERLQLEQWTDYSPSRSQIPQQNNFSDCGVFTCKFADYLSEERELDFSAVLLVY